jgi:hypothetical protein
MEKMRKEIKEKRKQETRGLDTSDGGIPIGDPTRYSSLPPPALVPMRHYWFNTWSKLGFIPGNERRFSSVDVFCCRLLY